MNFENFPFLNLLGEWVLSIGVLVVTLLVASGSRVISKKIHKNNRWPLFSALAPTISNIAYIIGLKLFVDVAPLHGRMEAWIDGTVYIIGILILLGLAQKAAMIAIEWGALRTHQPQILQFGFIPLLRNLSTLFIFMSGGIMVLKHFNYDVMSLVTALGVGSLAVGLASKDTLSNMISGFILIIDRNLHPGDRINLSGSIGDVREIGLRSTQILTADGNTLIVPNAELVNTKILNLSVPTRATSCSVAIRIPFATSFARVREICLTLLAQMKRVSKDKPQSIHLISLSEGNQLIQIGFWIEEVSDSTAVVSELNELLLARFGQEKIDFASPISTKY